MSAEFYKELCTPEMVAEFAEAWRADDAEVDGQRTYNVHRVRLAMEQSGYPWQTVAYASTQAVEQIRGKQDA